MGSGVVALLLSLMDEVWAAHTTTFTAHIPKPSASATKFLRAACTALRNAMLKSSVYSCQQAIQKEFYQAGGMQTVLRMLVKETDGRIAEKAAAVLTNATDGSIFARRLIFENDISCLLEGIGRGHPTTHGACWEFCAGAIRNLTVGGAALEDQTSDSLCAIILRKIALLCSLLVNGAASQTTTVQEALASLCGTLCNLSLMSDNAAVLEGHDTREVLTTMIAELPGSDDIVRYATQALSNLDCHASALKL